LTNYRQFGMEFECYNEQVRSFQSGANIQTAILAMGFPAKHQPHSHFATEYDKWQLKPDVTIGRDTGRSQFAIEVVSRTLPGTEASLAEVTKVANWLLANGYDVDRTCGYHVHLDAADLSSYEAAAIAVRYHHCRREIDLIMPPSRRIGGSNARWAQHITGPELSKVVRVLDSGDRTAHWSSGERYSAVNLQHMANARRDRRIEFRQHSGTLEISKILGWYKFLCAFVAETLRLLTDIGAAAVTTPISGGLTTSSPVLVRRQSSRRPARTRTVVVGTTPAPRIPVILPGTDYDRFLQRLENNGVVTTDDAREFGWMSGGTNATNSRLRVTAHWLRRNGAELLTTQRNGELAYVGRNGARRRSELFTAPAQIRQRVTSTATRSTPATADLHVKLETTPLLQGMDPETVAWFNQRKVAIGLADLRRAARVTP
jgi:hypothetical protein